MSTNERKHAMTAGYITEMVTEAIINARALLEAGLAEVAHGQMQGRAAQPAEKMLAAIAINLDASLKLQDALFRQAHPHDDEVLFVHPCSHPSECEAPYVENGDVTLQDGRLTLLREREPARKFRPDAH